MRTRIAAIVFSIAGVLPLFLGIAGCATVEEGPPPWSIPEENSASFREWSKVYHVELQGNQRVRKQVGFFYRQFSKDRNDDLYWVTDMKEQILGFLVYNFNAYRYQKPHSLFSKDAHEPPIDLGNRGLHPGIQRIYGLNSGSIELEKEVEQGESPPHVAEVAPAGAASE